MEYRLLVYFQTFYYSEYLEGLSSDDINDIQSGICYKTTNKQTKQTFSHFTPIFSGVLDVSIPRQIYTAEVPGRTVWTP